MLFIDGAPATPGDLAHQALVNYGAYTSFRVEAGAVRGLDRHLARLQAASVELFGEALDEAELRGWMREAVGERDACWLRVSLFSTNITHRAVEWRGRPRVMIGVFDPPAPLAASVRVQPQVHTRQAPHLKHVGTFDLVRARRVAKAAGFDDALFVDCEGRVSEGTLWNIGFITGDRVIWPDAPMLEGVTQALIVEGLAGVGLSGVTERVRLSDLATFDAAFLCNSATPAAAITAIGDHVFRGAPGVIDRITAAWASAAPQAI